MIHKPLVSCIINFFNTEKFIEEAIESLFAQTYDNWELLLVDDGSTDGSSVIAQHYVQQYPQKVRCLEHESHKNRGASVARNLGIDNAKGEYIAFLDADDVWLPQKLVRQVAILESKPGTDVIFGPTQYWYSWTGNPQDSRQDSLRRIGVQSNVYKPSTMLPPILRNEANAPNPSSILLRRSVCKEIGGFPEELVLFEDRAFFIKVHLKVSVFVTDEYLDRYRQHSDSVCHVAQKTGKYKPYSRSEPHHNFLKWVENYLTQENVADPDVWRALKVGILPYKNLPLHYLYQLKKLLNLNFNA